MNRKRWLRLIQRLWMIAGLVAMGWIAISFQARNVDPRVLQSDGAVAVTDTGEALVFAPQQAVQQTGLIFLPGGMVDPVAYVPIARSLAERGIYTAIVKLPWRLAMFEGQRQELERRVHHRIEATPEVKRWVLGGHSRGAALSVQLIHQHPGLADHLVLVGTSHPKSSTWDLSAADLQVTNIYASNDGLASEVEVRASAAYLPADTEWIRIDGGNHAQFGWYSSQIGDGRAEITREEQQARLLRALLAVLSNRGEK